MKTFILALQTEDDLKIFIEKIQADSPLDAFFKHSKIATWGDIEEQIQEAKIDIVERYTISSFDEFAEYIFTRYSISIAILELL